MTLSRASLQTTSITSPIGIRFVRLAPTEIRTRELNDNATMTFAIEVRYSTCQSCVETYSIHQWHRRGAQQWTTRAYGVHSGHSLPIGATVRQPEPTRHYSLRQCRRGPRRRPSPAEHSTPAASEHPTCLPAYLSAGSVGRPAKLLVVVNRSLIRAMSEQSTRVSATAESLTQQVESKIYIYKRLSYRRETALQGAL